MLLPLSPLELNLASSRCKILSPESGMYSDIARNLASELERSTKKRPEIVAEPAEPEKLGSGPLIVLGNLMDSKAARRLYLSAYDFTDLAWPGPGGYVLRTIRDPYGMGTHVLMVGGSEIEGVQRAAERLILMIKRSGACLGYVNEVGLGKHAGAIRPRSEKLLSADPKVWAHIGPWGSWQLETNVGIAAMGYLRTGDEAYLTAFRREMFWFIAHDVQTLKDGKPQMMHTRVKAMLVPWDLIRDHPFFSDGDRKEIDEAFLYIARSQEGAAGVTKNKRLLGNHDSGRALDAYFQGRYFWQRYGLEEAKDWLDRAEKSFRYQLQSAKPWEDYEVHETTTLLDTLIYAMVSGHEAYFSSPVFREAADRMMMCYPPGTLHSYYAGCAVAAKESGYLTLTARSSSEERNHHFLGVESVFVQPFCAYDRITPREDLLGVAVAPLDKLWVEMYAEPFSQGRSRLTITVPVEEGFDKISVREGWNPDDFFMLFDGISGGKGDEHKDNANCIVDYREKGIQWISLGAWGTGPMNPTVQNRVYAALDARGAGKLHRFARLMYTGQIDKYFFLGGALEGLGFVAWERHILRKTRSWTAIIDRVLVKERGTLTLNRYWLLHGEIAPTKDGALSRQSAYCFHLRSVGFPSEGRSGTTELRETMRVQVQKGHWLEFGALLYVDKEAHDLRYGLEKTTAGWRVTDRKGPSVGFKVASSGVHLSDEAAKAPKEVPEINALPLSVSASSISLPWKTTSLDDKVTAVAVHSGFVAAGTNTGSVSVRTPDLKECWHAKVGGAVLSLHFLDSGLLVGDDNQGTLSYFDGKGNKVWHVSMPYEEVTWPYWTQEKGRVNEITSADLNGDGNDEILVANGNGFAYAFNPSGKTLWRHRHQLPKGIWGAFTVARYKNQTVLLSGFFDPAFAAGCCILGAGGTGFPSFTPKRMCRTTNCDLRYVRPKGGDRAAIFCASHISCNQLEAYDSDGTLIWEKDTGSAARTIAICDRDHIRQIVCGTGGGYVLSLEAETGNRLWKCYIGEAPLLVWPLPRGCVLAVCPSGVVYVIRAKGELLGSQDLGSPVTAVLRPGDHRSGTDMVPLGTADGTLRILKGALGL